MGEFAIKYKSVASFMSTWMKVHKSFETERGEGPLEFYRLGLGELSAAALPPLL